MIMYDYICKKCDFAYKSKFRSDELTTSAHPEHVLQRVWGFHPDLRNCR